jgi:hypothetical protein
LSRALLASCVSSLCALTTLVVGACTDDTKTGAATSDTTVDLGPDDPGPGGVRFAASGEALALAGYAFPPASDDAPVFVDGWELSFHHLIVTVDHVTLSESPDVVPGDPSRTGDVVARISGPWAIDLARSDPSYLPGKGGPGELAVPFASVKTDALKTDGTRYAFGFDAVSATPNAKRVNLFDDADAEYARMIADGCVVLYEGTATFNGDRSDPSCFPDDRKGWPDKVDFRLCFKTPTTYINCQNPDNAPARPLPGEEELRGVALKQGSSVIAQVTFHTDHPFWDSVLHDSPLHFDPFAARVVGQSTDAGTPTVTLDSFGGVDYTAVTDARGAPLSWRYCVEPSTDVHAKLVGAMRLDPQTVPHAPGTNPAAGLRDAYDFVSYNQSTQGHLNSDGLCFVQRNYASPP